MVKAGKKGVNTVAEAGLDDGHSIRGWKGWHIILQARQFITDIVRQQIPPGGENLPKFDKDRPKRFE